MISRSSSGHVQLLRERVGPRVVLRGLADHTAVPRPWPGGADLAGVVAAVLRPHRRGTVHGVRRHTWEQHARSARGVQEGRQALGARRTHGVQVCRKRPRRSK
jgi:hypothetical protein